MATLTFTRRGGGARRESEESYLIPGIQIGTARSYRFAFIPPRPARAERRALPQNLLWTDFPMVALPSQPWAAG